MKKVQSEKMVRGPLGAPIQSDGTWPHWETDRMEWKVLCREAA